MSSPAQQKLRLRLRSPEVSQTVSPTDFSPSKLSVFVIPNAVCIILNLIMPLLFHFYKWSCSEEAEFLCSINVSNYHTCQHPPLWLIYRFHLHMFTRVLVSVVKAPPCSRWLLEHVRFLNRTQKSEARIPVDPVCVVYLLSPLTVCIFGHSACSCACSLTICRLKTIPFPLFRPYKQHMDATKRLLNYSRITMWKSTPDTRSAFTESSF